MTREEKQMLLKDLCARLPYGVKVEIDGYNISVLEGIDGDTISTDRGINYPLRLVKPFLRPMSSMTEEETRKIIELSGILTSSENILSISVKEEFIDIKIDDGVCSTETRTLWFTEMPTSITMFDYLNARHFDYRGLIDMGLALEAPEGMYNTKTE